MRRKCLNAYAYGDPKWFPDMSLELRAMFEQVTTGALSGKAGEKVHTEWKVNGASPKAQKALVDAFYSALYSAASQRCQMVREPGPFARVDASSANPFLNTLATHEPHVHLADLLVGYPFDGGVAYWVGSATAEGYAKDATTGALLWEGQETGGRNESPRSGYAQLLGRCR